jgi:hypothetical protein
MACSPYRFISAIHIPRDPAAHDILISGGGDPVIKVWQWRAGRRLYDVAIEAVVRPFIAVRRAQPKRGYDSDGERKPPSRRWLARQRRKEAKAAAAATKLSEGDVNTVPEAEAEGAEAEVDVGVDVDDDERTESDDETVDVSATPAPASGDPEEPSPAPVLVVQKIESSKIDGQLVIVFSAVGCVSHREWLCLLRLIYGLFNTSVRLHYSGSHCLWTPPTPCRKRCSYIATTLVALSSLSRRFLGALTAYVYLWTHIGVARVRHMMFPYT